MLAAIGGIREVRRRTEIPKRKLRPLALGAKSFSGCLAGAVRTGGFVSRTFRSSDFLENQRLTVCPSKHRPDAAAR